MDSTHSQLDLGEEDADCAVRIDEEVGALAARPAVATAVVRRFAPLRRTPTHRFPESREEALRCLVPGGYLVADHLPQMVGRNYLLLVDPAPGRQHLGEAVEVAPWRRARRGSHRGCLSCVKPPPAASISTRPSSLWR